MTYNKCRSFPDGTPCFSSPLPGGEKSLPAHLPAVPFSGHRVAIWYVVLLRGAFQRSGQRTSGAAQSAAGNKENSFVVLRVSWGVTTRSERLRFAFQKLQVPSIPISKCAACLKPPVSEEDKLKRCTRCYRVGYCNQWASWDVSESNCKCLQLLLYFLSSVPPDIVRELTGPVTRVYVVPTLRT